MIVGAGFLRVSYDIFLLCDLSDQLLAALFDRILIADLLTDLVCEFRLLHDAGLLPLKLGLEEVLNVLGRRHRRIKWIVIGLRSYRSDSRLKKLILLSDRLRLWLVRK